MRTAAVLMTLTLAFALTTAAQAWVAPPTTDEARLAAYLPVARAAWPGSPCEGHETVHLRADMVWLFGEDYTGFASPAACEVWLPTGQTAYVFCTALTHELGHLAGHGHTKAPGIMNGTMLPADYQPCLTLTLGYTIDERLRSLLPAPRASWQIACSPRTAGRERCVARSEGHQSRHYTVIALSIVDIDIRQTSCRRCAFS